MMVSLCGTNVPGNIRSLERKFRRTLASSRERKFPVGTFAPQSKNTGERKVPEPKKNLRKFIGTTMDSHDVVSEIQIVSNTDRASATEQWTDGKTLISIWRVKMQEG